MTQVMLSPRLLLPVSAPPPPRMRIHMSLVLPVIVRYAGGVELGEEELGEEELGVEKLEQEELDVSIGETNVTVSS